MKKLLRNFSFTIFSNLSNTIISILVIFIIPKLITQHDYGMFQVFLFYFSYAGLLQLGWLDGIYLRYGGIYYSEINKEVFKGQFYLYSFFQLIIFFVITGYSVISFNGNEYFLMTFFIALGIITTNLKGYFQFVLQLSNRISEFAFSNIISSVTYGGLVGFFLLIGIRNYNFFILANIIAQVTAFSYTCIVCKDILSHSVKEKYLLKETYLDISSGIKIAFASIAAMLILGIVRLGVQKFWSISTFGKVSLVLSICNLLMLFINAASLVLFPTLRRIDKFKMKRMYKSLNNFLMPFLYLLLLIYYPVKAIIWIWLPKYQDTLVFMSFLFPLGLYQGKFEVMTTTFFKVWRLEKDLMIVNIISLICSTIFTFVFGILLHNLSLLILSIIITLSIRSFISEYVMYKKKKINLSLSYLEETFVVITFIAINYCFSWFISLTVYFTIVLFIFTLKRKSISESVIMIKSINYSEIE